MIQEQVLYTIKYRNSEELICDYATTMPLYKKRIRLYRLLGIGLVVLFIASFFLWKGNLAWLLQLFYLVGAVYEFSYPLLVKRAAKQNFRKDPLGTVEREVRLYDDRLEIVINQNVSTLKYSDFKNLVETEIGIYLYTSQITALCIRAEAVSPKALEFLRKKIVR